MAAVGERLRELMQQQLTALEQVSMMRGLNRAVLRELDGVHYATMVAAGWHGHRGLLVLTNAGHPPPCWYRAAAGEWSWIEARGGALRGAPTGVALGLLDDVSYVRRVIKPQLGDLIVLHTDGVFEATNEADDQLGREGLIDLVRGLDKSSAAAFGRDLLSALRRFRGGSVSSDDETIIVLERVAR